MTEVWVGYCVDTSEYDTTIVVADSKDKAYDKLFKKMRFTKEDLEGSTVKEFLDGMMEDCQVDGIFMGFEKRRL